MPTDNRRIPGPENSVPYSLFSKPSDDQCGQKISFLKNGKRKDGRKCSELRRSYVEIGVVSQAKGSAYIEQGGTKVICSVFDPREIPNNFSEYSVNGKLYCELKFAPFSCHKRRGHIQDSEEKELSYTMRRCLESAVCRHEFPNFQVDVYAMVLEDDGSALATAITCASVALAAASVPMYDLVVAATLAIHGKHTLLDPTAAEEAICNAEPPDEPKNNGLITVSFMPTHQQISNFVQSGSIDHLSVTSAMKSLTDACEILYPVSQQCLVKNIKENKKSNNVSDLNEIKS